MVVLKYASESIHYNIKTRMSIAPAGSENAPHNRSNGVRKCAPEIITQELGPAILGVSFKTPHTGTILCESETLHGG